MKIETKNKFVLFTLEDTLFDEFFEKVKDNIQDYTENNIVLDVLTANLSEYHITELTVLSSIHKVNKKSFVVIQNKISINEFDESILVVPTLQEAKDIVEMEDLERELGF